MDRIPPPNSTVKNPRLVIGIGNKYRGDDGVGGYTARKIAENGLKEVKVVEDRGESIHLMDMWDSADEVVLIDAVVSGQKAGTVHRFEVSENPLPKEYFPNFSTHTFSIADSIELARALDRLPAKLTVYGIEVNDFTAGEQLSPVAMQGANEAVTMILQELTKT